MFVYKIKNNIFILALEPGDELFSNILKFANKRKIKSGFFYGLGATNNCTIGYYDSKSKNYKWKNIKQQMEIGSLVGNLTLKDKNLFLHIHSVLGNKNFVNFSCHLKELFAYPTCEIIFWKFDKKIKRVYNENTNLFLIK